MCAEYGVECLVHLVIVKASLAHIDGVTNTSPELIIPYAAAINRLKVTLDACQERVVGIESGCGRYHGMDQAAEQLVIEARQYEHVFCIKYTNTGHRRIQAPGSSPINLEHSANQQKIVNSIAFQYHRSVKARILLSP